MSVIVDGSNGLIFNDASTQTTAATGFGFKNRIINGAMVIDQRCSAASPVTVGSRAYAVDRWCAEKSGTTGSFTFGQSSTAPAGFTNSFLCTVTTADSSVAAGDIAWFEHHVEGYNIADLGWGTASAATVTLSFWARSSLTGTYSIVVQGGSNYSANYTINAANTWEQKTITIPGATVGSWNTTTSTGLKIRFGLMVGSNYQLAPGSWTSGDYIGSTSQVNWMATNGNTFYITGVQLEKGSTATSFDYRSFGHELQLCQRYYEKSHNLATAPADGAASPWMSSSTPNGIYSQAVYFKVSKRAAPTMYIYNDGNGTTAGCWHYYTGSGWSSIGGTATANENGFRVAGASGTYGYAYLISGGYAASAEL